MTAIAEPTDLIDVLAHEQAFREMAYAARRTPPPPEPAVSVAELWGYTRRPHNAPADLRIESALRNDKRTAARYRAILRDVALAHSPLAMAAGSGTIPDRQVGQFLLRVIDDADSAYLVLSTEGAGAPSPAALEVHGSDGLVRIELSAPVRGHITVALEDKNPDHTNLLKLLGVSSSELFLL
jgi:hypothetical protein